MIVAYLELLKTYCAYMFVFSSVLASKGVPADVLSLSLSLV